MLRERGKLLLPRTARASFRWPPARGSCVALETSSRRDRQDGRGFLAPRLHESEDEHDEREEALRAQIAVVDRVPVASIGHSHEGVIRVAGRARDPNQRRDRPFGPLISFWCRSDPSLRHLCLWYGDVRREVR